jgi:hypothetical protein
MSPSPLPLWTAAASDAAFTAPEACVARASAFERRIARRNRRERIAGLIQLPFWGGLGGFFLWEGEWLIGLALLLCGAGVLVVLRNLARRASNLAPQPEEPCLTHLERQYRRQYDALQSVPLWYVGPLVPGTRMSRKATSGSAVSTCASASSPSPVSSEMRSSGQSRVSAARRVSRSSGSSSSSRAVGLAGILGAP